jgi:hypothetical protein
MSEQELSQVQTSMLASKDVEETGSGESQQARDDASSETKLRAMRTICLSECAIAE